MVYRSLQDAKEWDCRRYVNASLRTPPEQVTLKAALCEKILGFWLNKRLIGPAVGLLAVMTLLVVCVAPAYAQTSEYSLANVIVKLVWTSSNSQAANVTVNSATDVTVTVTNEDSQGYYYFQGCIITVAAPTSAKFLSGFTCGLGQRFTLAPGATTSYTGPLTIPGPPTFLDSCPGGCNLVISYVLTGVISPGVTQFIQSYPGYLIANLQPYAGTGF